MEKRNLVEICISTEVLVRVFLKRLWHRGNCSEPIYIEVFVPHKGSGRETRKDERKLGQLVRLLGRVEKLNC